MFGFALLWPSKKGCGCRLLPQQSQAHEEGGHPQGVPLRLVYEETPRREGIRTGFQLFW